MTQTSAPLCEACSKRGAPIPPNGHSSSRHTKPSEIRSAVLPSEDIQSTEIRSEGSRASYFKLDVARGLLALDSISKIKLAVLQRSG